MPSPLPPADVYPAALTAVMGRAAPRSTAPVIGLTPIDEGGTILPPGPPGPPRVAPRPRGAAVGGGLRP